MLQQHNCGLMLIDIQGKLARMVYQSEPMVANIQKLIQASQALSLPIIWMEQLPDRIGSTIPEVAELLVGQQPLLKSTFSGCDSSNVLKAIEASGKTQWLVCGIEAHICVYQTVSGLLEQNYQVEVVQDAVSSRLESNLTLALNKMERLGAAITSVEMSLFELVKDASKKEFKAILPLIK